MELLYWIFTYGAYISLSGAMLVGYLSYKNLRFEQRSLLWYLTSTFSIQLIAWFFAHNGLSNLFLYPIYTAVEFILLGHFLAILLKTPRRQTLILLLAGGLIVLNEGVLKLNDETSIFWGKSISHLIIIIGSSIYLYWQIQKATIQQNNISVFLLLALIGYFSISTFLFFFVLELKAIEISSAYFIWGVHNILLTLLYIACFIYFLKQWNLK